MTGGTFDLGKHSSCLTCSQGTKFCQKVLQLVSSLNQIAIRTMFTAKSGKGFLTAVATLFPEIHKANT